MNFPVIFTGIFVALSIVLTIVSFTAFRKKTYSKFLGASSAVYTSGCLIVFLFAFVKNSAPKVFFILSDLLISGVYVFTSVMVILICTRLSVPDKKQE